MSLFEAGCPRVGMYIIDGHALMRHMLAYKHHPRDPFLPSMLARHAAATRGLK